MGVMRPPLLMCAPLLLVGCASLHPVPDAQREPFFECPGVSLAQAERHLAAHGFVTRPGGGGALATEVTEVALDAPDAQVFVAESSTDALVDIHERVRVRILVHEARPGTVRYQPFWGHREDVAGHRGAFLFPVSKRLFFEQVRDEDTFALLSKMYAAVCGEAPVGAPWPR